MSRLVSLQLVRRPAGTASLSKSCGSLRCRDCRQTLDDRSGPGASSLWCVRSNADQGVEMFLLLRSQHPARPSLIGVYAAHAFRLSFGCAGVSVYACWSAGWFRGTGTVWRGLIPCRRPSTSNCCDMICSCCAKIRSRFEGVCPFEGTSIVCTGGSSTGAVRGSEESVLICRVR